MDLHCTCISIFQLYIEAYDAARPRNKALLTVFITVLRNENFPTWTFNVDTAFIREDKPVFTDVVTVSAQDVQDGVSAIETFDFLFFA